ncbi:MAG: mechanosensitive ion channel family protein [Elusimicrobiota bacterium]
MQEFAHAAGRFLSQPYFGIAVYQYLLALFFVFAGFVSRRLCEKFLDGLSRAADKTKTRLDDVVIEVVRKPLPLALLALGLYLAIHSLPVPTEPVDFRRFLYAGFRSVTVLFTLWLCLRVIDGVFVEWAKHAKKTAFGLDEQLLPIVQKSLKVFLLIIGGILFLQNMGYSVGSLLAGFGLGGAAVALAAKDSLSNLFGSIVVLFDRPFRVGDWIEMPSCEGTVEEIGLRTTRVRTFANSLVTVPNMMFTTSIINNWSRMNKRRITFRLGLTYNTPADKIEAAVNKIRELIKTDDNIRKDFFLVNFDNFGPHSLDILIYCFTRTTKWAEFLDAKQKFFLSIVREMQALGVEIAFPTQTVHVGSPVSIQNIPG